GHCGAQNKDSDMIVALSMSEYANGMHCGKRIKISYSGKTILATVADSCSGCSQYGLDLSPAAFKALAPIGAGQIPVTWSY
ncbi:RlpA-like double-psi beta-barrel-protein domain-containing protein-containing protein, partial [Amanita rubescens]